MGVLGVSIAVMLRTEDQSEGKTHLEEMLDTILATLVGNMQYFPKRL